MKFLTSLTALLFAAASQAQTPNLHWKYQDDGKSYAEDRGICTTFDNNGNIITAGYVESGCSGNDILVIKYNPVGDTLWYTTYDGAGTTLQPDLPRALTTDGAGNIYVTGVSEDAGFPHAVTLKYDPAGNLVWANRVMTATSAGNDVAVDGAGNVYMCGYREISNNKDFMVICYNAQGSQQWAQYYSNGNHDEALSLEATPAGAIYVTGRQSGVNAFFDWATLKYNASGSQQWVDVFGSATAVYSEEPVELGLDAAGNIFVVGTAALSSISNHDYYLIKYNPSGSRIWEFSYSNIAVSSDEFPVDMTIDNGSNVFITGNVVYNPGGQDLNVIKVNATGALAWEMHIDSIQQTDYARAIEVDPTGNYIYVAGDVTVPPAGPVTRDIVMVKLDTSGTEVGRRILNGPGNNFDLPYDLSVNANGTIAMTGMQSMNNGGTANGDASTFLIDPQLNISWERNFNGDGFADDQGTDMVVDAAGNSYVCGFTKGGDITNEDLVVFKVDATGQLQWRYLYQGTFESSSDIAKAITIDDQQNIYVTGVTTIDTTGPGSYSDIYTAKLDASGNLIWYGIYGGSALGDDTPSDIAVDSIGNVYVAATTVENGTGVDGSVICYGTGGGLSWSQFVDKGGLAETFSCLAVDQQQNIYLAGAYYPPTGALCDGLLVKFDPAGTMLWDTTYDFSAATNDRDFFNSMALDNNGNVFVAGQANLDFVTIKYDPTGNPQWIQNYSFSNNPDSATVIKVDVNGDVLVGGIFGQFIEQDFGIVKYKNDGSLIWDRKYTNTAGSDDMLCDLITDSIGNIYVTGWETDQFSTNYNFMTLKYDSAGVFKWELIWSDSLTIAPDYGKKLGLDGNGHIYIMGDANENCFGNSFVNGFRWNTQVLRYGQGIFSGSTEPDAAASELKIFPNPNNGQFTLIAPSEIFGTGPVIFTLYDISGKKIEQRTVPSNINYQSAVLKGRSGIFIYTVTSDTATRSGRISVQGN